MTWTSRQAFGVVAALLLLGAGFPAEARIECANGFQNVQGSWLSTPYCQDALVAQVAGAYGIKASADAIRENPNYKRYVCRFIGQDIRIKESCDEVNSFGRGRF